MKEVAAGLRRAGAVGEDFEIEIPEDEAPTSGEERDEEEEDDDDDSFHRFALRNATIKAGMPPTWTK